MAMSKSELKEAINQTIVANGQKSITAESLNNLLNEIVDSMGDGSGSGGGVVFLGGDGKTDENSSVILTQEELAHNAEMFKIFKGGKTPASLSMKEVVSPETPDGYVLMIVPLFAMYVSELLGVVMGFDGECCIGYSTFSGEQINIMVKPSGEVVIMAETESA